MVRMPTLVLHRQTDAQVSVARGRDLAAQIPGAKYIEYPDGDHAFWTGDTETLLGDIEEFVTGHRESASSELERVLATVLFTDIVDSTRTAAAIGDQNWRRMLDSHDQLAHQMVERHRGVLVKSTGDGILATFDGPGRAVRCALACGIAVHGAARVMAQSQPSEVLVSRVVTDLVAGAGLKFAERGSHELKGLPGRWDLFAASGWSGILKTFTPPARRSAACGGSATPVARSRAASVRRCPCRPSDRRAPCRRDRRAC